MERIRKKLEDVKKLNTPRLLSFYRVEHKKFRSTGYREVLDYYDDPEVQKKHDDWKEYLESIKKELDSRQNV